MVTDRGKREEIPMVVSIVSQFISLILFIIFKGIWWYEINSNRSGGRKTAEILCWKISYLRFLKDNP